MENYTTEAPQKGNKMDELAWEDYGIKRLPGETDEQLRRRLHEIVDNKNRDTRLEESRK